VLGIAGKKRKREEKQQEEVKECESDKEIDEIKQQIQGIKGEIEKTDDPIVLEKLETEFKHLFNRKTDRIRVIRKKYRIKVEGERVPPP
jgi:DNA-binding FrmR family transcriptional regulator